MVEKYQEFLEFLFTDVWPNTDRSTYECQPHVDSFYLRMSGRWLARWYVINPFKHVSWIIKNKIVICELKVLS